MNKKEIIVLGGGFGGVTVTKKLAQTFARDVGVNLTLVNRSMYHEYHADLYEVATSAEEITGTSEIRESVLIPLSTIFNRQRVKLVYGEVQSVDLNKHEVQLSSKLLRYDYLVYALGSTSCFYNIPGAREYALPLKSSVDALRIRNSLAFAFERHRRDITKYNLRVVVVGGGFTGVEFSAELMGLIDVLCWKNGYPREKVEVVVMEAASRVLCGLPENVSRLALNRLLDLGVHVYFNSHIVRVDSSLVYLANNEQIEYDVLVWTAGVEGASVPVGSAVAFDRCMRIVVDDFLQVSLYRNAFFIGDAVSNRQHDPSTAQYAMHQAQYVAKALPQLMQNKRPTEYKSKQMAYIIPLGGTCKIFVGRRFVFTGLLAHVVKFFATFRYYKRLVGTWKAVGYVFEKFSLYGRNN